MNYKPGCCVDTCCDATTCMTLPLNASCRTCTNNKRCTAMGYVRDLDRTVCDFFPRKYVESDEDARAYD